jgi:LysM repeat protein
MVNDPFNSLDLSTEELEVLESINIKVQEQLNKTKEDVKENPDKYLDDPNILGDHPLEPRHVTDYNRELYISLKIEMTALDENCNFKEITQVVDNAYHIPVPSGVDYQVKVDKFVNKFDKELGDCAEKISISKDDDKKE